MEELLLLRNKKVVYEVCNEINCICTWQMYCPFCGADLCLFVALCFVVQTKWSPRICFFKLNRRIVMRSGCAGGGKGKLKGEDGSGLTNN
jgi:hypothetical protein